MDQKLKSSRKKKFGSSQFWIFQSLGWLALSLFLFYWNSSSSGTSTYETAISSAVFLFLGLLISYLYRQYMIYQGWLALKLTPLIPRVIIASIVFGGLFTLTLSLLFDLIFGSGNSDPSQSYLYFLGFMANISFIFILWSSVYLNYNYYKNYEKEEIKNLKLLAVNKEVELQNLKTQLNPHFIFNAMNSIRALIDEDPELAQKAITQLSSIIRSGLMASKRKFAPLKEEMETVTKYLDLEKIRYEERLQRKIDIEPALLSQEIPPLLISTLVENAVKHGIATHRTGGTIEIAAKSKGEKIEITIVNPGQLQNTGTSGTQIGLENTRKRLSLLYGEEASIKVENKNEEAVISTVVIPKNKSQ